jgi:hypothetical protein
MITAGIAQTQKPPAAKTTRPAVFMVTEQTITDQAKYEKAFAPAAIKTIKDAGERFIVRGGDALRSLAMRPSASSSPAGNPSMMSRKGKAVNTPS